MTEKFKEVTKTETAKEVICRKTADGVVEFSRKERIKEGKEVEKCGGVKVELE